MKDWSKDDLTFRDLHHFSQKAVLLISTNDIILKLDDTYYYNIMHQMFEFVEKCERLCIEIHYKYDIRRTAILYL